ncbi:MAG: catalase-related domain-containing protein, partial [Acidobacteriaceae bacterium]
TVSMVRPRIRLIGPEAQQRLINNIVSSLSKTPRRIQELQVSHFYKADRKYGEGVARGLGLPIGDLVAH